MENNLQAKLLLNNKDPHPKEILPTIYSMDGQTLELPPVTVEVASFRFIDLNDWALIGGANFRQGSIRLRYTGKDLTIGAQIYLTDETNSLSFEEKFAEEKMMDSLQLEGVWWQPTNQTNSRIVLSNTTNENLTVTARLFKRPQHSGDLQTFQLLPHQTRVLRLREDFSDGNQFANSDAVSVSVSHNGAKTALIARALISDVSKGYSMVVPFSNPNTARSKQLHGAGLHLDNVQGERLTPVLVLRNPSVTETYVTVRVPYTRENGTRGMVTLSPRRLRSGEIDLVNLNEVSQRAENEQIKTAGIEIEHNTNGAAIIAQVQSVSSNRNQVMRTLLWDAPAQKSATGGYPWLIDETSATRVFIKNITNEVQQYVSFIRWENGGMYMLGLKTLEPHETVAIEVKKLRDNQTPDEQGRVIPININRGQLEWTLRDRNGQFPSSPSARIRLVGQAEQVDLIKGISSAYFCQQCCQGSYRDGYLLGPADVDYGGATVQYEAWEIGVNCYNTSYIYRVQRPDVQVNWSSSNQNIATIDQNGILTTVAVGQTNISAEWGVTRHINFEYCGGGPLLWENATAEKFVVKKQVQENLREPKDIETDVPDCNSCTSVPATLDPEMTVHVNPRVRILQYQEPGTSNFVDITGTLYVLKDTTVTFKAAPDPPNSTFPANMPTWSGTAGATGTGATKQLNFNTVSQNPTDYKTVIAGNPTPVTVNVIVYELTGTLEPDDNFTGHSTTRFCYSLLES